MDEIRKKVIGSLSRAQLSEVSKTGEIIIEIEADEIMALIDSYSREARQEGFKAGQEDIINHYHHDRTIRRAIQEATLKATGKALGGKEANHE